MTPKILIIREGDSYRLLHGHLHLASALAKGGTVSVDIKGEGQVKIVCERGELLVHGIQNRSPLQRSGFA